MYTNKIGKMNLCRGIEKVHCVCIWHLSTVFWVGSMNCGNKPNKYQTDRSNFDSAFDGAT